jgi:biotin carboxyl carrier protein
VPDEPPIEDRMTPPSTPDRRVRVTPGPATRQPDDEPIVVAAGDADLEVLASGRARLSLPPRADRAAYAVAVLLEPLPARDRASRPTLEVIVDGWRFELMTEAEARASLLERARRGAESTRRGGPTEIRAVIPGRVVGLSVAVGDEIEAGQEILVIEAMKMQNELRAPRAGTVERLAVGAGSRVEVGDVLAVIR